MIDYLDIARQALDRYEARQLTNTPCPILCDPSPESPANMVQEYRAQSGEAEALREEVWVSSYEWKARELNKLFEERGKHGPECKCSDSNHRLRPLASITAETVRDGLEREVTRRENRS